LKAEDLDSGMWALLGVKYVAEPLPAGRLTVRERAQVMPRAFLVSRLRSPDEAQLRALASRPRTAPADAEALAALGLMPGAADRVPRSEATFLRYEAERVALAVSAPSAGWLVLTDCMFPGWRCYVNEAPARIHSAYGAFRAVSLAGDGRVEFVYWPASFAVGFFLAALALCVGVAVLTAGGAHR